VKRAAKLNKADRDLIDAATAAIKQRYRDDWQEVGAALRTRSGKIFTGVNLDAYLGRMAVCAEAVALGRAVVDLGDAGLSLWVKLAIWEIRTKHEQRITIIHRVIPGRESN